MSDNLSWSACLYIHCGVRNHFESPSCWKDTVRNGCNVNCTMVMSTKRTPTVPMIILAWCCIMLLGAQFFRATQCTNIGRGQVIVKNHEHRARSTTAHHWGSGVMGSGCTSKVDINTGRVSAVEAGLKTADIQGTLSTSPYESFTAS